MRFISKLFAKKVNPIEEKEVFVKCGECSLSQKQYPHAPFYYEYVDTSKVLCESCYEKHLYSWGECGCGALIENEDEFISWNASPECSGNCSEAGEVDYYRYGWKRMPRLKLDYSNEPQVWGFMVVHTRATDRVYFGPFRTRGEIDEWMDKVGLPHRVGGSVYPLMNPQGDPEDFWYIPNDMPWDEVVKPKKDRPHINGEYAL